MSDDPIHTPEALVAQAVEQLLSSPDEASRRLFLQQNPQFQDPGVVLYLAGQIPKIVRDEPDRAMQLGTLAIWLAEIANDDYCRGRSARAMGHPLQLKGKLRESLAEYQKALDLFTKLGLDSEIAITLSGSLQPLILLGDYAEAYDRAERARKIFKAAGDELRLARLDANLGNILHRQDRFDEALVLYHRAEQSLQRFDEIDDLAIVLNNLAVCYISLNEFRSALDAYRRLRGFSEQRQMQSLTAQADYNIAYLHFLQGEHQRAIEMYKQARIFCARVGDPYHAALCDLDHSEICLHEGRKSECAQLAGEALTQFQALGMNYEAAKANAFLGLAACDQKDPEPALEFFAKAHQLFTTERNSVWPALIDLYRAIVLFGARRWRDALDSATAGHSLLSHSALKDKAAIAELLLSLLHLELGEPAGARYWSETAQKRIEDSQISGVRYLAEFVRDRVKESPKAAGKMPERSRRNASPYRHLISAALRLPGPKLLIRTLTVRASSIHAKVQRYQQSQTSELLDNR